MDITMKKTRIVSTVLSIAFGTIIATASSSASATTTPDCTVMQLAYDTHLLVSCSGDANNYYGYAGTSCSSPTTVTADTIKIWQSMLTAALLSGRKVIMSYNTGDGTSGCVNGARYISNVVLK